MDSCKTNTPIPKRNMHINFSRTPKAAILSMTKCQRFCPVRPSPGRQVFIEWVIFLFYFEISLHCLSLETGARAGLGPSPGWGPYGPLWAHIWAHMGPYGPIYGPIWALMGPLGQVLAGPDMSDFRLLVEFCMFWIQNWVFEEISK